MTYLIVIGFALAGAALSAGKRVREGRWPREGHGVTYFARPGLRQ
ncbi:MAG TPA: hypothetical protein VEU54_02395 [Steroidobacteraceae bacterium]|jgi:hypothetical protein|nr:hypothetical protein [Steroidobacteraceae bacterium]